MATTASLCLTLLACSMLSHAFAPMHPRRMSPRAAPASTSALNVWWFGGTERTEAIDSFADSCELVAVRIERTSPNSRRIAGEITVETPLQDVWAILTDYDQLAVHVPNLVESKTVPPLSREGDPGDGQYKCRLHQRGAQKIIGFEFGASVTMDMTERVLSAAATTDEGAFIPQSRMIEFKCVESPFFSEFDGSWKVTESLTEEGKVESVVSYSVEVRPRGPVPVAALEWRIREDVPTNLRAVKHAALTVGYNGVMAERRLALPQVARTRRRQPMVAKALAAQPMANQPMVTARLASYPGADWGDDETMAAYLKKD
jgi:Polyketide cyclase / dehydrase and lipid transport